MKKLYKRFGLRIISAAFCILAAVEIWTFRSPSSRLYLKLHQASQSSIKSSPRKRELDMRPKTLFLDSTKQKNKKLNFTSTLSINELSFQIFRNLERLQDLKYSDGKYFLCIIPGSRGLGSIMHVISQCLSFALGTNRTLLIDFDVLAYEGLQNVFTFFNTSFALINKLGYPSNTTYWTGELASRQEKVTIVKYKQIAERKFPETNYIAYNMPKTIADQLVQLNISDPNLYWRAQFLKYMFRVEPWVEEEKERIKKRIDFTHPIVGVHIRRTDKILEVDEFKPIEDYMNHVTQWYEEYELTFRYTGPRKVYIATDKLEVVETLRSKYPNYTFLFDSDMLAHTSNKDQQYSNDGLLAYTLNILLLKECDLFVGTFSSNCGRLIYELKSAEGIEDRHSISTDDNYDRHGPVRWDIATVNYDHPQKEELELQVGDKIRLDGRKRNFDNFRYGYNERTKQRGFYAREKAKPLLTVTEYKGFD